LSGTAVSLVGGDPGVPMSHNKCVCCQCTHQEGGRSMCGSRTGGWSLPGVMTDLKHGVD
jgi:hypothetical protein